MRAFWMIGLALVACGDSDNDGDPKQFIDQGGVLAIDGCNYMLTTRIGAEQPVPSGKTIGMEPTPRQVHLGIMGDPKTSIVAQWRTADETTTVTTLRYGTGEGLSEAQLTNIVKGVHFRYNSTGTDLYRIHQAHVCGLEPGTTYSYQVGADKHWSPVYTFHTAPDVDAHPDAEVVLAFVGDSRGGYDVWTQLVDQIKQRTPDLVLFSGDAITIGLTQYEWEEFLTDGEPLFATTPVVLTNGNHEANAINYFSQFAMPGDQENFGFDYGFAHVFVANDSPDNPSDLTDVIPVAMDADFTDHTSARWKMLMSHRPMYSSGTRHGSAMDLQAAWGPVVDKHKVDLVLNGHEHMFEISKPLFNNAVQASNADGTVYVVAGGAGAELYGFGTPGFWTDYIESAHTAATIRVRRDQLTLDSFRPDGTAVPNGFTKTKP
ncbi:MAG TPA: metallophosphoesterase family protein [Kofleriaceae bacterium]|nr:metallophosphoesterase family protein [Kofleriaceae bacterium]